ncbi:hypothetical protein KBD61_01135 [Patescibacteria group bacterium]|nr:hypothetical protein [Patescibacteria group bacterium]MBP9709612.1 hypothetical protein [Patescibacteria group bacterium]
MSSPSQNLTTNYERLTKLTAELAVECAREKDAGGLTGVGTRRKDLEVAREALLAEVAVFVVPHAVNPYHEALLEAGLESAKTNERQETRLDLRKEIARQVSLYRGAKNEEGHAFLEEWVKNIVENEDLIYAEVAKDHAKIVERIKEGMIPVVMPGRSVQESTWEAALAYLKPIWVKDGAKEPLDGKNHLFYGGYVNGVTDKMTKEGFFKHIPERAYLVWVKPTQGPDSETMSKAFVDQQIFYAALVTKHPDLYDATDLIPTEYIALQATATAQIQNLFKEFLGEAKEPTNIRPFDTDTYTRFLSSGLFSDGDAPTVYFDPIGRQACFVCAYSKALGEGGFRPVARS